MTSLSLVYRYSRCLNNKARHHFHNFRYLLLAGIVSLAIGLPVLSAAIVLKVQLDTMGEYRGVAAFDAATERWNNLSGSTYDVLEGIDSSPRLSAALSSPTVNLMAPWMPSHVTVNTTGYPSDPSPQSLPLVNTSQIVNVFSLTDNTAQAAGVQQKYFYDQTLTFRSGYALTLPQQTAAIPGAPPLNFTFYFSNATANDNGVSSLLVPIRRTFQSLLYCEQVNGCSLSDMRRQCVGSFVSNGNGCDDEDLCGVCYYDLYLSALSVFVEAPANLSDDLSVSPRTYVSTASYNTNPQYLPSRINVVVRRSDDPMSVLQNITGGSLLFSKSSDDSDSLKSIQSAMLIAGIGISVFGLFLLPFVVCTGYAGHDEDTFRAADEWCLKQEELLAAKKAESVKMEPLVDYGSSSRSGGKGGREELRASPATDFDGRSLFADPSPNSHKIHQKSNEETKSHSQASGTYTTGHDSYKIHNLLSTNGSGDSASNPYA